MKQYSEKPGASISMIADSGFVDLMSGIVQKNKIDFVFESGTFKGTGSTKTLADIFMKEEKIPGDFYTIERTLITSAKQKRI